MHAERRKVRLVDVTMRECVALQILSEEKARIDAMAEGLEEESKKSLQMEAELEKQMHVFENDRRQLQARLADQEKR